MNNNFQNPQNILCECQCHFPPTIICPINHCCHCTSINNNINNFSPYSSTSSLFPPGKGPNMKLTNSFSTNFRSDNDTLRFQNSLNNSNENFYLKKSRNIPNQFARNFSETNIHTYNNQNLDNSQFQREQNIIHQEPYSDNNSNKNFLSYNLDINNQNKINTTIDQNEYPNYNNKIESYKNPINEEKEKDNNNINLTYDYLEEKKEPNELPQLNRDEICNNKFYHISVNNSPRMNMPLTNHEKIHDTITILQKENAFLKTQRDDALNKLSALENIKNIDKVKFEELEKENAELRQLLNDAVKKNNEKDTVILNLKNNLNQLQNAMHDKDREMNDLILNMKRLEQEANNELDKLRNDIEDLMREKEAMARNYEKEINDLNNIIRDLNNKLADMERKVQELLNKIKNMKRFDDKKQKLLENLFNWYNSINKLLNTNTANGKAPPKDLLSDIINLSTNEEFKAKLDQIEDKLKQFLDNYKLKFGECFACDIACCTSEVDRLRYFRKYYPGPPKNYLEGKKKCKCS